MVAARAGGFATAVEGGLSLGDERRKSRALIFLQEAPGISKRRNQTVLSAVPPYSATPRPTKCWRRT